MLGRPDSWGAVASVYLGLRRCSIPTSVRGLPGDLGSTPSVQAFAPEESRGGAKTQEWRRHTSPHSGMQRKSGDDLCAACLHILAQTVQQPAFHLPD